MPLPPLRYLDIIHAEHEGERVVLLSDSEGVVEHPLALSPVAFYIAAQLDGEKDITDIQYAFSSASGGRVIREEDIVRVVEMLDEHGFLLTEKYLAQRAAVIAEFNACDDRPAYFAGKSYPSDPQELREYLDTQYLREGGPGQLPVPAESTNNPVPCLIVPHIDYDRGGHAYAHGYIHVASAGRPDTVIVLGVAHAGSPTPFVLTRKNFDTPLGKVQTDCELVDEIASRTSWDVFTNEIVHRTEHSVEFQAVMLAHLFGSDVRMVPILCGPFLNENNVIAPEVDEFITACATAVAASGKRVMLIASADLAHVGPRFGDEKEIDQSMVESVRLRDQEDLAPALSGDAVAWFNSVMSDDNARRVCGVNCVYAAVAMSKGKAKTGDLVHYDYAADPGGGIVSFASVVYSP